MKQEEADELLVDKSKFSTEQSNNYKAFINCLADIITKNYENKDIDKHFI